MYAGPWQAAQLHPVHDREHKLCHKIPQKQAWPELPHLTLERLESLLEALRVTDFLIASIHKDAMDTVLVLIRCCFAGDDVSCALWVFEEGCS